MSNSQTPQTRRPRDHTGLALGAASDHTRTEVAPRRAPPAAATQALPDHLRTLNMPEDDSCGGLDGPGGTDETVPGTDAPPGRSVQFRARRESLPVIGRDRYRRGREIARGGLGRITETQDRRLGREVAIKELLDQPGANQARFLREALITARLQHPAIVPVYEVGYWPDGAPFYAMKLVAGRTLADRIRETTALQERLAFLPNLITVIDAVAYAHSRGIIHRDIKPANVVLGEFGETMVVDWGLAKDLHASGPQEEPVAGPYRDSPDGHTVAGTVMGTPGYMAPEQAQGAAVDERADIYALGAMLYYMLTGEPPFRGSSADEILVRVGREPPPPLVERVPDAPRDLVTVANKAMERDPAGRYQSAREMADDLRRFENGQRVSVHHYSAYDVLSRWLRRHRALVAVSGAALVALAVVAAVAVRGVIAARDVAQARYAEAQQAKAEAQANSDELTVAASEMEGDATASVARLKRLSEGASNWGKARTVVVKDANRGVARHVFRDPIPTIALSPDGRLLASSSQNGAIRLRDLGRGAVRVLDGHDKVVLDLGFSPDGQRVVSASGDGQVIVWTRAGRRVYAYRGAPAWQARFSPDGALVASSHEDGEVVVHDVGASAARVLTRHAGPAYALAFSPGGAVVASGSKAGAVRLSAVSGGADVELSGPVAEGSSVAAALAFSPDGGLVASGGADRTARVWRVSDGRRLRSLAHADAVTDVLFSRDGERLATASADGAVTLWDVATGEPTPLGAHDSVAYALAASPDDRLLASSGEDGVVRVWNVKTRAQVRAYTVNADSITQVVFSPDGARLWSAGYGTGVRAWDLASETMRRFASGEGQVVALALSPDGEVAAVGYRSGRVLSWRVSDGSRRELARHAAGAEAVAFSPDGALVASASADGEVRVHDRASGTGRRLGAHAGAVVAIAFTRRGDAVVTAGVDGAVALWSLAGGGPAPARILRGEQPVRTMALASDGESVVAAGDDGAVRAWSLETGQQRVIGAHAAKVWHAAFSPAGDVLATSDASGEIRLWPADGGAPRVLRGHERDAMRVAWAPGGDFLASFGQGEGHVVVWDVRSGASRRLPTEGPRAVGWSADGTRLVTTAEDSSVKLWDAASGRGTDLVRLVYPAQRLAMSPDGSFFVTGDRAGDILVWRDDLPTDRRALRQWLDEATTATIAPERLVATPRPFEPPAPPALPALP